MYIHRTENQERIKEEKATKRIKYLSRTKIKHLHRFTLTS